jgi:hypothetical protein
LKNKLQVYAAMLLDSLKRNTFLALSVCLALLTVLWIPSLFSLVKIPAGEAYRQIQAHSPWTGWLAGAKAGTYIALILTFITAASFVFLNNRHLFLPTNEFLLPLLYTVFASAIPATQWFSGVQAAVLMHFIGLNYLFASRQRPPGFAELFIAAFCFALASLCFPPAFLLLLLLPVATMILRTFAWRDWVIMLFGALTPYAYFLFYCRLTARDSAAIQNTFRALLPESLPEASFHSASILVFFGSTAFILLLSLMHHLANSSANKVKIMHIRAVFTWMLLLATAGLFLYPAYGYQIMPLLAVPVTAISANYMAQPGGRKIKCLCWLLLLAAIVYMNYEL